MRAGLRLILEQSHDVRVVGEAATGDVALHSCLRLQADVVLMHVRVPEMDGLEATRRLLAHPDNRSHVIVLTTFDLDEYVYAALRAGASGFLLKGGPATQLVEAVHVVAAGEALLTPTDTRHLIAQFARRGGLTPRRPRSRNSPSERPMFCAYWHAGSQIAKSPTNCSSGRRRSRRTSREP
jgi:DNA-binding NarL/FixJ family response regulator